MTSIALKHMMKKPTSCTGSQSSSHRLSACTSSSPSEFLQLMEESSQSRHACGDTARPPPGMPNHNRCQKCHPPSPCRASFIIACFPDLNIMPPCRNLCENLAYPCFPSPSPYELGLRYCTQCAKYFDIEGSRCPCCNRRLRYRRHGRKGAKKC